jgi:hypothetical protein
MITIVLISMGVAGFGLASVRYGTESRPEFDEHRAGERFGALR